MAEASHAVFLSYASQDAEAAQKICDALRAAGIEVWFDQSELRGGDAWDRKIRDQIRHCALFIPVISAHSQARLEGYFRREWKFAVERKRDIADELVFLLPVVIDETSERGASVPEGFHEVQWTRLPGGAASQEFIQHVSGLLRGHQHRPKPAERAVQPTPAPAPARPAAPAKSGSPLRMWLLLSAVVTAVIAGYIGTDRYVLHKGTERSAASRTPTNADKSIAVLPFVDLSEKHDQEYFADGMAEEVIDLLTQVPEVRVIARASSFQFKGKNEDVRKVGASLGAAFVVEGSIRRSQRRIRVTAQLIGTQDGAQRWSESYDRDMGDVLKVQKEIAAGLVRALQVSVGAERWFPAPTLTNLEAYDLFLRGLHAHDRYDKAGFEEAANDFQRVLELEPTSARAAEALALTHFDQASFGLVQPRPGFELARQDAQYAIRLDSRSELGHGLLARVHTTYDWDWDAAKREATEALAMAPRHPQALFAAAEIATTQGRWDEAERFYRSSLNVDPLNADTRFELAFTLYRAGRLANAEAEARRALEISPSYVTGHSTLAWILLAQGQPEAALREIQQEVVEGGQLSGLAIAYQALGRKAESNAALKRATRETADSDAYGIALAHAFRGEADQAFEWLDRAFLQKDIGLAYIKGEPLLKSLERDPRYKTFLRKMNLPE